MVGGGSGRCTMDYMEGGGRESLASRLEQWIGGKRIDSCGEIRLREWSESSEAKRAAVDSESGGGSSRAAPSAIIERGAAKEGPYPPSLLPDPPARVRSTAAAVPFAATFSAATEAAVPSAATLSATSHMADKEGARERISQSHCAHSAV
ncbi:hypothetical protein AAVH_05904 [Aphelenchoides avenae]|nr:hypothetical protein AAVH_05904 [Aphelenchus avenae]